MTGHRFHCLVDKDCYLQRIDIALPNQFNKFKGKSDILLETLADSSLRHKDLKINSIGRYYGKSKVEHFSSIGLVVDFVPNGGPVDPGELLGEVKIFENWTKEFCYERTYKIRWIKRFLMNVISLLVQNCWALYQYHFNVQKKLIPYRHGYGLFLIP